MTRSSLPQNYQNRAPITLVDWVSSGLEPSDTTAAIAGSQIELVADADVPEGSVPGGGRCVKLSKDDDSDSISIDLVLPAAVNLVEESCVIEASVYYPGPFNEADQTSSCGINLQLGSGGGATNSYAKTFSPSVNDPRLGWNTYSFPLQSLDTVVGMTKLSSPDVTAINFIRMKLNNTGASGAASRYAYLGSIKARRRTRTQVAITIDDGLVSVYTKALPIMSPLNIPASMAIVTDSVGSGGTVLTWAQISELVDTYGWSIASHGVTGDKFRTGGLTDAQVSAEVEGSVQIFRDRGYTCDYYVWSGGEYTEHAKTVARSVGLKACLDTGSDFVKTPNGLGLSGDFGNYLRAPAEDTGGTVAALAMVDEAIKVGLSCFLYAHDIVVGASGANTTNETEWQTLMDALWERRAKGLIDIVNLDDWGAGMSGVRTAV